MPLIFLYDINFLIENGKKTVEGLCYNCAKEKGINPLEVLAKNANITNEELDDIIMTIPTLLYFISEQQEKLGIKHDVSKSSRELLYNKIYMDTPGTAGIKKARADSQLVNESLVNIVYSRTYTIIKSKVDFALELLQSAKKILSRRISENEITKLSTGTTVDPFNSKG